MRTLAPQAAPAGIYASKYDPVLGAAICRRVAAGESLRSICRADPSMPTEKTVWNWARAHPEFAGWWDWARLAARRRVMDAHEAREAARRARWGAEAAAVKAGPARGRALYAGGPGSTGRPAWNRGRSGYGPEIADAICNRLCLGETLPSVCRAPQMPSVGTVYNWLRAHPEFVAAYRWAKQVAFSYVVETATEAAPWLGTEQRSMRRLGQITRAAHRRCAQIAPKAFAEGIYGPAEPQATGRGEGVSRPAR